MLEQIMNQRLCAYHFDHKEFPMSHLQHAPRSNTQPLAYFGSLPLLEGEDPAGYDALLARVSDAIRPTDILEEIWIQEIVALAWEAFRLRRARAAWLTATRS